MEDTKSAPVRLKVSRSRHRLYQAVETETSAPVTTVGSAVASDIEPPADSDPTANAYRLAKARRRVDYYSATAGTIGVMPLPLFDMFAVAGLQLKLIHDLSRMYHIPFSDQRAKAAIAALLGGAQTGLLVKSLFKYIPVYGYAIMAVPTALAASGVTYAIGRVFIHHFELGGTLLDFDAARMRGYFREQLRKKTSKTE
jgi:uncharacterized protein (DUF697 family)